MPNPDTDPTPTPGGAALRHPDDPPRILDALDRCYPHGLTYTVDQIARAQSLNDQPWHPAQWHRPLDQWWVGERTYLPLPVEARWEGYRAAGRALLRRAA